MFKKSLLALASVAIFSGPVFAASCPEDIQKIDDALANSPAISETEMNDARALRALGEEQCITGKVEDATSTLNEAKNILGIQ